MEGKEEERGGVQRRGENEQRRVIIDYCWQTLSLSLPVLVLVLVSVEIRIRMGIPLIKNYYLREH